MPREHLGAKRWGAALVGAGRKSKLSSCASSAEDSDTPVAGVVVRLRRRLAIRHRLTGLLWSLRDEIDLRRVIARVGDVAVAEGPFVGMRWTRKSNWARAALFITGSYEFELADWIERFIAQNPSVIVDVGCADGYYAVGMARRLPESRVFGFDTDPRAQNTCRELAVANGVAERVSVAGLCSPEKLNTFASPHTIIIVDCEGHEVELLRPDLAPRLAESTILVELHEFLRPGLTEEILGRFASTHEVTLIEARPKDPARWFAVENLAPIDQLRVIDERRPTSPQNMQWAVLEPFEVGDD